MFQGCVIDEKTSCLVSSMEVNCGGKTIMVIVCVFSFNVCLFFVFLCVLNGGILMGVGLPSTKDFFWSTSRRSF